MISDFYVEARQASTLVLRDDWMRHRGLLKMDSLLITQVHSNYSKKLRVIQVMDSSLDVMTRGLGFCLG